MASNPQDIIRLQHEIKQNSEELRNFVDDLSSWETEIKKTDEKLIENSVKVSDVRNLPPVRGKNNVSRQKQKNVHFEEKIKSSDYAAWDKFNVDEACEKVDKDEDGGNLWDKVEMERENRAQDAHMQKELGNGQFRKGNFVKALEHYSKGILSDPWNAVLPANRAMANLKLKRYVDAEDDASKAITIDSTYSKAYFRRGQARYGRAEDIFEEDKTGCVQKLFQARSDFEAILNQDRNNSEAKQRLADIKRLLSKCLDKKGAGDASSGIEAEIISDGISGKPLIKLNTGSENVQKPIIEVIKDKKTSNNSSVQETNENDVKKECASTVARKQMPGKDLVSSQKSTPNTDCEVPKTLLPSNIEIPPVPKNSVQLEMYWKQLKGNKQLMYKYLLEISPKLLPNLFSEFLNGDILSDIVNLLHEFFVPNERNDVLDYLDAVSRAARFETIALFLSLKEKVILKTLFEYCLQCKCEESKVKLVARKYKIQLL